jgi:hypothetical protein
MTILGILALGVSRIAKYRAENGRVEAARTEARRNVKSFLDIIGNLKGATSAVVTDSGRTLTMVFNKKIGTNLGFRQIVFATACRNVTNAELATRDVNFPARGCFDCAVDQIPRVLWRQQDGLDLANLANERPDRILPSDAVEDGNISSRQGLGLGACYSFDAAKNVLSVAAVSGAIGKSTQMEVVAEDSIISGVVSSDINVEYYK